VVDPADLVERLLRLVRRTVGERISISTAVEGEAWPVRVDPSQMENAILNLVTNARDAMDGEGRLVIRCAAFDGQAALAVPGLAAGEYVCTEVEDNGCGMTDEVRERAFEPFYTTKPVGQGTGLGLSQVYGFVKQSGGHVVVASAPGEGTRVRLYLPRAAAAALQPAQAVA
jgi:signal transduction histidine kinase